MQSIVVVKAYVTHDMRHRYHQRFEPVEVLHLCLQAVVKRLHSRIIPTMLCTAFAISGAVLAQQAIHILVAELDSTVRVEDQPQLREMISNGHQQRFIATSNIRFIY